MRGYRWVDEQRRLVATKDVLMALLTAVAFAVAFTCAQMVLDAQSCKWVKLTEPVDGTPVYVNWRVVSTVYDGGSKDKTKSGSVLWYGANENTGTAVRETPAEIFARCGQ